jgi:hypothetical protein
MVKIRPEDLTGREYLRADMLGENFGGYIRISGAGRKEIEGVEKYYIQGMISDDSGNPVSYGDETLSNIEWTLNKTNLGTLYEALGNETYRWIGELIPIYTTTVQYKGKNVLGIRVAEKPKKEETKAYTEAGDEISGAVHEYGEKQVKMGDVPSW